MEEDVEKRLRAIDEKLQDINKSIISLEFKVAAHGNINYEVMTTMRTFAEVIVDLNKRKMDKPHVHIPWHKWWIDIITTPRRFLHIILHKKECEDD